MAERHRPRRPDLDEPFTLHPLEGEEMLERLLNGDDEDDDEDDLEE
jgi:hypothetical protein